jgi:hypothetical protein
MVVNHSLRFRAASPITTIQFEVFQPWAFELALGDKAAPKRCGYVANRRQLLFPAGAGCRQPRLGGAAAILELSAR